MQSELDSFVTTIRRSGVEYKIVKHYGATEVHIESETTYFRLFKTKVVTVFFFDFSDRLVKVMVV